MRSLAALCLLLLALPAWAQDRDDGAELVATEAARVRDEFCLNTADSDTTLATQAVRDVSQVWTQVSEELDRSRKVYLLYWRGVLGQCLSQEERAIDDFTAFVRSQDGRALWESLVDDAKLRLQRLKAIGGEPERAGPAPPNPGGVLGVILAGGAGAAGGLAGWQWYEASLTAEFMYAEPHSGATLLALGAQGDPEQLTSRIFVGSAAALGTGAVISWVVAAATSRRPHQTGSRFHGLDPAKAPSLALLPAPDGATLVLAARW